MVFLVEIHKYLRISTLLLCSSILSACSFFQPPTINESCGAWTFGIAKPSKQDKQFINNVEHEAETVRCLQTHYANGFALFDSSSAQNINKSDSENSIPVVSLSQELPSANKEENVQLRSAHLGSYELLFLTGSDWKPAKSPSPMYQYFAKNTQGGAGLFISVFDANPFMIWSDVRDSVLSRFIEKFDQPYTSKIDEIQLNGRDAFQAELWGKTKDGAPLHFLSTLIKYEHGKEKKLIYLATWCFEIDYKKNQHDFKKIAETISLRSH
ncbi:hypothetical protein [Undibacterium griseum]|uniref:Lipoprotein n=1 Tax=Undibacterium griseum TaxID=2762295 RepID=A0ABR6YPA1_9BURK|nr:hypothetical protein [Undibacterium griseum]MBC3885726.1 hypothetical protein [Undibacterium griseum]